MYVSCRGAAFWGGRNVSALGIITTVLTFNLRAFSFSYRQQLALTSYRKPCIWRIEQWVRVLCPSLCTVGMRISICCNCAAHSCEITWKHRLRSIYQLLPDWQGLWRQLPALFGAMGNHLLVHECHWQVAEGAVASSSLEKEIQMVWGVHNDGNMEKGTMLIPFRFWCQRTEG